MIILVVHTHLDNNWTLDEALRHLITMFSQLSLDAINIYLHNYANIYDLIRSTERLSVTDLNDAPERFHSHNLRRIHNYCLMTTTGDGNCLWNAVSNALFGDENFTKMLRLFTFYSFINNQQYFHNICVFETNRLDFYIRE